MRLGVCAVAAAFVEALRILLHPSIRWHVARMLVVEGAYSTLLLLLWCFHIVASSVSVMAGNFPLGCASFLFGIATGYIGLTSLFRPKRVQAKQLLLKHLNALADEMEADVHVPTKD